MTVHIINTVQYSAITGRQPPRTPVSASYYTDMGLPWFDLYDEDKGDLRASQRLGRVKTVKEKDLEADLAPAEEESSIEVSPAQVKKLQTRGKLTKKQQ